MSEADGKYKIEKVSEGTYTIVVAYIGYRTVEYTNIKVNEGQQKELNVSLNFTSFSVDQEIVVVGDRPLLDIEMTSSNHIISSDDISKSSVNDIKDIVTQLYKM